MFFPHLINRGFLTCPTRHFKQNKGFIHTWFRQNKQYQKDKKYQNTTNNWHRLWAPIGIVTCLGTYLGSQYRDKLLGCVPLVSAATPVLNSLSGRRERFNFIADAVDVVKDKVVYIEIKDTRRVDYFTGQPLTASNGSGFIIDENGLILTNAHVVINKPNSRVSVKLYDGRSFTGIVEAVDPTTDLALIRIRCKNLPVMKLGQSSDLRSGEWVIAMGSPLSLNNTVTAGVVSSTQRYSSELGIRGKDTKYIQTDAAITFGNSGGPLINLNGEAIGINSMKVTPGISFAIPIDYAKEFLQKYMELRKSGKDIDRPPIRRYMGITMLSLTPEILQELKQRNHDISENVQNGILVWKVISGGPAHLSNLMPGDIITEINGRKVKSSSDVYECLAEDRDLNMVVYRENKKLTLVVRPEDPE